jgi:hypothetical protein
MTFVLLRTLRILGIKTCEPTEELGGWLYYSYIKPEGTRRVGTPQLSWLESVEEDLKKMGRREELETLVAGPRKMEDSFGRG